MELSEGCEFARVKRRMRVRRERDEESAIGEVRIAERGFSFLKREREREGC